MPKPTDRTRYQVMYTDPTDPKGRRTTIEDFAAKAPAERRMADLRARGARNVRLWDCLHNPISDLLKL